jgi:hypothetical protein
VFIDVFDHPYSTISEITTRSGLLIRQVSTAIAKFRKLDVAETPRDPKDGKRTLVKGKRDAAPKESMMRYELIDDVFARVAN